MQLDGLLPDRKRLRLDRVRIDDENGLVEVVIRGVAKHTCCPECGCTTSRIHSRYQRRLADLPWQGFNVIVLWISRRFFCTQQECPQKIFTERVPQMAASHARRTERLSLAMRAIALACGGEGGSRLADRLGIKVSPDTLLKETRHTNIPAKPVPRVLGVDDWAFRKRQRYGTVLVDLERGVPVELLPDRTAESLKNWLEKHPGIEIISRDRGDFYIKGATEGAPQATQVADRFHLVQNLRESLLRLIERRSKHIKSTVEQTHKQHTEKTVLAREDSSNTEEETSESPSSPSRQRRLELYRDVVQLRNKGISAREIARRLGTHRTTVGKFARSEGFPERALRQYPATTDPFMEFLRKRWNEGCHNVSQLTREIHEQGYRVSYYSVRRRVIKWRTKASQKPAIVQKPLNLPSSRGLSWMLLAEDANLSETECEWKKTIVANCPEINGGLKIARGFLRLIHEGPGEKLTDWLKEATKSTIPVELQRFARGIQRDLAAVQAAMTLPWSNGPVEGHVNRLKTIKRQMYGRGGFDLLRLRFLTTA